jgi:ATP-dependent Clp protease ATP-binding subunit ClpC
VFHSLGQEHINQIVGLMVEELRKRLNEQGIDFEISESAKTYLSKQGYEPAYGARPLRRAIQKYIEDRLSEELLKGTIAKGDFLKIDEKDGELTVETAGNVAQ